MVFTGRCHALRTLLWLFVMLSVRHPKFDKAPRRGAKVSFAGYME